MNFCRTVLGVCCLLPAVCILSCHSRDNDLQQIEFQALYEATVEVDGQAFQVSCRRLAKPILISESFNWSSDYTNSPTDTVLAHLSMVIQGAVEEDYYSTYEDQRYANQVTQDGMKATGIESFDRYLQKYGRDVFMNAILIGEIVVDEITLVVVQFAPSPGRTDQQNVRTGIPVVKIDNQYLMRAGAKENSAVLRHLSAHKYAVLD